MQCLVAVLWYRRTGVVSAGKITLADGNVSVYTLMCGDIYIICAGFGMEECPGLCTIHGAAQCNLYCAKA